MLCKFPKYYIFVKCFRRLENLDVGLLCILYSNWASIIEMYKLKTDPKPKLASAFISNASESAMLKDHKEPCHLVGGGYFKIVNINVVLPL